MLLESSEPTHWFKLFHPLRRLLISLSILNIMTHDGKLTALACNSLEQH